MKYKAKYILFVIVCVCAVMATTVGALAALRTTVKGSDSVPVAAVGATLEVTPGKNLRIFTDVSAGAQHIGTLVVTNVQQEKISEVKLKYEIIINSDIPLSDEVDIVLKQKEKEYLISEISEDHKTISFVSDDFVMPAGKETRKEYEVYVLWPKETSCFETQVTLTAKAVVTQCIGEEKSK